jgi:hypothetical protein
MASNGTIHGRRKLYAALISSCWILLSSSVLCYLGKIDGTQYNAGLTTASLLVMAYLGANAVQKFAPGEKK